MTNGYGRTYPPPRSKRCRQCQLSWLKGLDKIVHYAICDIFVEYSLVPELLEIEFQAFQLDTFEVGNILKSQGPEIRLAGLRADGSELGAYDLNRVIPFRELVFEYF